MREKNASPVCRDFALGLFFPIQSFFSFAFYRGFFFFHFFFCSSTIRGRVDRARSGNSAARFRMPAGQKPSLEERRTVCGMKPMAQYGDARCEKNTCVHLTNAARSLSLATAMPFSQRAGFYC